MIQALKAGLKFLLTTDKTNSRFVFLLHGIAVFLGTLALIAGYMLHTNESNGFALMIGTLTGGGGLVASAGRFLTKAGDAQNTKAQTAQSADAK